MPAYNILIMGAAYGSLLASKMLFGGHKIRMRGISRVETVSPRSLQTRLDVIWRSRQPARPSS